MPKISSSFLITSALSKQGGLVVYLAFHTMSSFIIFYHILSY